MTSARLAALRMRSRAPASLADVMHFYLSWYAPGPSTTELSVVWHAIRAHEATGCLTGRTPASPDADCPRGAHASVRLGASDGVLGHEAHAYVEGRLDGAADAIGGGLSVDVVVASRAFDALLAAVTDGILEACSRGSGSSAAPALPSTSSPIGPSSAPRFAPANAARWPPTDERRRGLALISVGAVLRFLTLSL